MQLDKTIFSFFSSSLHSFVLPYIIKSSQSMIAESCSNIILLAKHCSFSSFLFSPYGCRCVCVCEFVCLDRKWMCASFHFGISNVYAFLFNVCMSREMDVLVLVYMYTMPSCMHKEKIKHENITICVYYLLHTFSLGWWQPFHVNRNTHLCIRNFAPM